jgi:hypothetical protein
MAVVLVIPMVTQFRQRCDSDSDTGPWMAQQQKELGEDKALDSSLIKEWIP